MLFGQVQAFIEVARTGNVSRAAEALYVTQPALTARIQALEKELGEALFVRTGRGVRLTDAGRVFLPCALLCLAYALGKAFVDLVITGDRMVSTTAAVAALSALQLTLVGMLGEAIALRLWHMGGTRYVGVLSRTVRRSPGPDGRAGGGTSVPG